MTKCKSFDPFEKCQADFLFTSGAQNGKPYSSEETFSQLQNRRRASSSGATGFAGRRKPCAAVIGQAHYGDRWLYHSLHRAKDGLTGPPRPSEHCLRKNLSGGFEVAHMLSTDGCSRTGSSHQAAPLSAIIIISISITTIIIISLAGHFHLSGNEGKVGCSGCSISRVNLFAVTLPLRYVGFRVPFGNYLISGNTFKSFILNL